MSQSYIRRSLEPMVERAAREFPAVVLTGPRQSGKTTLLQHIFGQQHRYVRCICRMCAPRRRQIHAGSWSSTPPPVIFDEVQHAPHLLPYIKAKVDARRNRKGQ